MVKLKFEDISAELDTILKSKRSFWSLGAICHMDYDDVCQIIRLHVYQKFSQWHQDQPFAPWAARIINNQITNLREKHYGKFAPPCRTCEFDLGGDRCEFTSCGMKTSECPKFAEWQQKKEEAYHLVLATSSDESYAEDPGGEGRIKIESSLTPDYFAASSRLHSLMQRDMSEREKKIYRLLFIENRSDEFVARELGWKSSEKGKPPGYRRISGFKKSFKDKAKKILKDLDIFEE